MSRHHANRISALYFGFAACGLFWGAMAAAMPELQRQSGTTNTGFGALLFLMIVAAVPLILLSARLVRRLGTRAMPISLAMFAGASLALGLASGPVGIACAMMAVGAASGALDATLNIETSTLERSTGEPLFQRAHAMFPLSLLIASPATGFARDFGADILVIFATCALVLALLAIAAYAAGRTPSEPVVQPVRAGSAAWPEGHVQDPRPSRRGIPLVVVALAVLIVMASTIEGFVESWGAIYVESGRGTSATLAGAAAAIFTLGLGIGRMLAHTYERHHSDRAVLAAAGIAVALGFIVIAAAGPLYVVFLGLFVAGVAAGPIEPLVLRTIADRAPSDGRHKALCLATLGTYVGLMLAPPLFGWLSDTIGWDWTWASGALLGLATLVAAAGLSATPALRQTIRRKRTEPTEYPAPKEQISPI